MEFITKMVYQNMGMLVAVIVLSAVGYIRADYEIRLSSQTCGANYELEDTGSINFIYNGVSLGTDKCSVSFDNPSTYSYETCVKPVDFQLDCATTLEYHTGFIKHYIQPENRFGCHNVSDEEWCNTGRSKLYIVLKKRNYGTFKSDDLFNLHISLKSVRHDSGRSSTSYSTLFVGLSVLPLFLLILIIIVLVYKYRKAQSQPSARTMYTYQTTSLPMSSQIGHTPQVGYQPGRQCYQPQSGPQNLGDYQLHPMQTAYPSSGYQPLPQQQAGAQHSYFPQTQQIASDPRMPPNEAPPPAYESIVPQKH